MPAADASELYGLPLECFIAERGALAKELRDAGEKEEAARVSGLRKPSVAAWTVNHLVRTQSRAVAAAFSAGDELQRAQSELLAGRGDASALREATTRERQAVDELAKAARGLLSSEGHEPAQTTLDRVSETLHAGALNDAARAQVQEGCLERELRQVGFGGSGAAASGAAARPARTKAPGGKRDVPGARAEQAAHERARRERAERLKSARKAEAVARRLVEHAARELHAAQERRDRAASSLRDADEAMAAVRNRAEEAALAHTRAQEALEGV